MIVGTSCMITMRTIVSMRVAPALEHARQAAGLALEMEAQRELVHVLEGPVGEPAHRVHRHLGEDAVAHLGEHRHQDAHAAIGDRHQDRRREHPDQPGGGATGALPSPASASVAHLKVNGTAMVASLAASRSTIASTTRSLQVAPVGRPDIGPQSAHGREQRAAVGGHVAFQRFGGARMGIGHEDPARTDGPRGQTVDCPSYRDFPDCNHPNREHPHQPQPPWSFRRASFAA